MAFLLGVFATGAAVGAVLVVAFLVVRKRDEESIKRGMNWD